MNTPPESPPAPTDRTPPAALQELVGLAADIIEGARYAGMSWLPKPGQERQDHHLGTPVVVGYEALVDGVVKALEVGFPQVTGPAPGGRPRGGRYLLLQAPVQVLLGGGLHLVPALAAALGEPMSEMAATAMHEAGTTLVGYALVRWGATRLGARRGEKRP